MNERKPDRPKPAARSTRSEDVGSGGNDIGGAFAFDNTSPTEPEGFGSAISKKWRRHVSREVMFTDLVPSHRYIPLFRIESIMKAEFALYKMIHFLLSITSKSCINLKKSYFYIKF